MLLTDLLSWRGGLNRVGHGRAGPLSQFDAKATPIAACEGTRRPT
jgi:hypothetical protein